MKLSLSLLGLSLLVLVFAGADASLSALKNYSTATVDVSWPNCRLANHTLYEGGIIGVTGGLDFHPNKCLANEASWFNNYLLYMNTGYPGAKYGRKYQHDPLNCRFNDQSCLAFNYGYQAARYALVYAAHSDVHSSLWWLDVETDNSWTNNTDTNQQVLIGAESAVLNLVPLSNVGFYSYPAQWQQITGQWHNQAPVWVATGGLKLADALAACHQPSFSGGPVWLAQYTKKLDINISCQSNHHFAG